MDLKIYGSCPDCGKLKNLLEGEFDYEACEPTDELMEKATELGYFSLPIIEIDGAIKGAKCINYVDKLKLIRGHYEARNQEKE